MQRQRSTLEIAIKILMGSDSLQIDQLNHIVKGITQQVKLTLTAKLVDQQTGQIAFFSFAYFRLFSDKRNSLIDIRCNAVLQLFILACESPRLPDCKTHARRLRGTKGVA